MKVVRDLAALKAGETVDLPVSDGPHHWWHRARVSADGTVQFYDDTGSAWLAENGL